MDRRHGELTSCAHMDALGVRFVPPVQGAAGMGARRGKASAEKVRDEVRIWCTPEGLTAKLSIVMNSEKKIPSQNSTFNPRSATLINVWLFDKMSQKRHFFYNGGIKCETPATR